MIRHIVMFKLNSSLTPEERKAHLKTTADLTRNFQQEISSLAGFRLAVNSGQAPSDNYDIALICDFDSMEDLELYQKHPVHKEFGSFIVKVRESRACIDFEL